MMLTGHKTRLVFERYKVVSDADLGEDVAKLAASLESDSRVSVEKVVARDGIEPPDNGNADSWREC